VFDLYAILIAFYAKEAGWTVNISWKCSHQEIDTIFIVDVLNYSINKYIHHIEFLFLSEPFFFYILTPLSVLLLQVAYPYY
jgi:hypothetical protein